MTLMIKIIVALVAIEHFYILYMEMFAWTSLGRKTFKGAMPDDLFAKTKTMAANQGLYNGFLAAGLIWSLCIGDPLWSSNVALFFLTCVAVAGIYAGLTVSKSIFYTQAGPALLGIASILFFN